MNSIYRGNFSNETQLKIYLTDVNKTDFYTKTCCTLCMNTVAAHLRVSLHWKILEFQNSVSPPKDMYPRVSKLGLTEPR